MVDLRIRLITPKGAIPRQLSAERLKAAFTDYFKWRKETSVKVGKLQPIKATNEWAPLFPTLTGNTAGLLGQHRDLGAQINLVYHGTCGGVDSLPPAWKVSCSML